MYACMYVYVCMYVCMLETFQSWCEKLRIPQITWQDKKSFSQPLAHTDGYNSVGISSSFHLRPGTDSIFICEQKIADKYQKESIVTTVLAWGLSPIWMLRCFNVYRTTNFPEQHIVPIYKGQNAQEERHLVPRIWDQAAVPKRQQLTDTTQRPRTQQNRGET